MPLKHRRYMVSIGLALVVVTSMTGVRPARAATLNISNLQCKGLRASGFFVGPFVNVTVTDLTSGGVIGNGNMAGPGPGPAPYAVNIAFTGGAPGDTIHVDATDVAGGAPPVALTIPSCSSGGGLVTWCTFDDGRIDGHCADTFAAYCGPSQLKIIPINADSMGGPQTEFAYSDLIAAGPGGVSRNLGPNGVISVTMDDKYNFFAALNGGPLRANGVGTSTKVGNCASAAKATTPPTKPGLPAQPIACNALTDPRASVFGRLGQAQLTRAQANEPARFTRPDRRAIVWGKIQSTN